MTLRAITIITAGAALVAFPALVAVFVSAVAVADLVTP